VRWNFCENPKLQTEISELREKMKEVSWVDTNDI
jgi:hypothetical protein